DPGAVGDEKGGPLGRGGGRGAGGPPSAGLGGVLKGVRHRGWQHATACYRPVSFAAGGTFRKPALGPVARITLGALRVPGPWNCFRPPTWVRCSRLSAPPVRRSRPPVM